MCGTSLPICKVNHNVSLKKTNNMLPLIRKVLFLVRFHFKAKLLGVTLQAT